MKKLVAFGKFATTIIIMSIFMLVIHVQTDSDAEYRSQLLSREDNCYRNVCGGIANSTTELFEGTYVCHYRNDSVEKGPIMDSKCQLDCMGYEAAEDQAQCMCDYCKMYNFHEYFCKEPGIQTHIKKDECETEVCTNTGNVKYFRFFCQAYNEKHFASLKAMMDAGNK